MEFVKATRRRKKTFKVYLLTFSGGETYIGYTSQAFIKRWRTHSATKTKSAVNDCFSKYGIEGVKAKVLATFDNSADALQEEQRQIKKRQPCLNKSKGGEKGPLGIRRRKR